jgi:hypothetical protein
MMVMIVLALLTSLLEGEADVLRTHRDAMDKKPDARMLEMSR